MGSQQGPTIPQQQQAQILGIRGGIGRCKQSTRPIHCQSHCRGEIVFTKSKKNTFWLSGCWSEANARGSYRPKDPGSMAFLHWYLDAKSPPCTLLSRRPSIVDWDELLNQVPSLFDPQGTAICQCYHQLLSLHLKRIASCKQIAFNIETGAP